MKKIFLFLIVLVCTTFAQSGSFNATFMEPTLSGGTEYLPWIVYAIISLIIITIAGAIVYTIGKAFNIPRAVAWAQSELVNMLGTFIMIIIMAALLELVITTLITQVVNGNAYCMGQGYDGSSTLDFSMCKVQQQITTLEKLWNQAYEFDAPIERKAKTCYTFWGVTVQCGDWFGPTIRHMESAHYLGTKCLSLIVPLHAEYSLLQYIGQNMLALFLPLGLLLRTFPLTRGVGGLLISISFGLYFVFPMLNFIMDPSFVSDADTIKAPEEYSEFDGCWKGYKNTIQMISYTADENVENEIDFSFARAADIVAEITVTALFYPIVAFAGAIMFIYLATPFFSGEIADFTRVVQKLV